MSRLVCRVLLFPLIAVLLSSVTSFGEETDLKAANESFEITAPNGMARDWSADLNYFNVEYGGARTGNASLMWESKDAEIYRLCSQRLPNMAGRMFEFSVYVKTENVKGGRAAVCVEWNRGGKYGGGAYAQGINGTVGEWTRVHSIADVPSDADSVSITCYVTRGGTGRAWFDDVELKPYIPPILTGINTDHYRDATDGTPLRVRVGVSPKAVSDPASIKESLVITGESLGEPISIPPTGCGADYVEFIVPCADLKPGDYQATFQIKHPADGSEASISRRIVRVEKFPERKTYIDSHRRAIVDGKPFFPLGCYFGSVKKEEFEIFRDSAFNCLMPYNGASREMLDLINQSGFKVIYSVKDNFEGLAVKTKEEGIERTKKTVLELKNHPAIFAWYINDELPLTMLDQLTARRDLMEELDPGRPTWVVLYQVGQIRSYIPTFDIIGTDPYPIPGSAGNAGEWSLKTNAAVFHQQAVWQVPQIFNWAAYRKTEAEKKAARAPTYAEMRGMAWMNIAGGANGLVFYSWFDLLRMEKTVGEGGPALVAEPFAERWAEVKKMAAEIADCFPILLSVEEPKDVRLTDDAQGKVMMRLYGHEGKTWALLVNRSDQPNTALLALPEGAIPAENARLGGKTTRREDGAVAVELAPLEPAFLEIQ